MSDVREEESPEGEGGDSMASSSDEEGQRPRLIVRIPMNMIRLNKKKKRKPETETTPPNDDDEAVTSGDNNSADPPPAVPGPSGGAGGRANRHRKGRKRDATSSGRNQGDMARPSAIKKLVKEQVFASQIWTEQGNEPYIVKLRQQLRKLKHMSTFQIVLATKNADNLIRDIRRECDFRKIYVNFFFGDFMSESELRDKPGLYGFPVALATDTDIFAVNQIGAEFGVTPKMSIHKARKLCRDILVVPVNFGRSAEIMEEIVGILRAFDQSVSTTMNTAGICLIQDVTMSRVKTVDLVRKIQGRIYKQTRMRCSAGIGPTPLVASLASTRCGPLEIFQVKSDAISVEDFMRNHDLTKNSNLSPRIKIILRVLNICSPESVIENRAMLTHLLKKRNYCNLIGAALGIPTNDMKIRYVRTDKVPSIVTHTVNFFATVNKRIVSRHCWVLCVKLQNELRDMHLGGKVLMAYILTADMQRKKKAHSTITWVNDAPTLYNSALTMMSTFYEEEPSILITEIELQVRELHRCFRRGTGEELDRFLMPPPLLPVKEARPYLPQRGNISFWDLFRYKEIGNNVPKLVPRLVKRVVKNRDGSIAFTCRFVSPPKGSSPKPENLCRVCGFKIENCACAPQNDNENMEPEENENLQGENTENSDSD